MVVENFLALGNARRPGGLVAGLGGTGNAGSVACAAHLLEGLVTRLGCGGATGAASLTGSPIRPDCPSGGVLASDGLLGDRLEACFNALQVLFFLQYLLVLGLAGDYARQGKYSDGDHDQQTDDHAEDVKEVGVLLAHVWIRLERL